MAAAEMALIQLELSTLIQKLNQLTGSFLSPWSSPEAPAQPPKPAPAAPAAPKPSAKPVAKAPTKAPAKAPVAPKPAPAPAQKTVTVQSGDSLWAISQRTLGDGARWKEIFDLNRDQLSDPGLIQAGMKLKLPSGANAPATQPKPAAPKPAATVTVQSGDSLSAIAQRTLGNGDRWQEIYNLNRDQLSDPGLIQPGMKLKLPSGANASAPAPAAPKRASSGINTNRDAFYIRQPNGWTCAPTSLTMALAAWGVRPANYNTVNEMINRTGANSNDGLPGNASLVASAARSVGMQAQFVGNGSPASVRAALQRGHGVVLNGSLGVGGHFIYVAGIASDGRFIIADPWRPGVTRMNDGELNTFANAYGNPRGFAEIWK